MNEDDIACLCKQNQREASESNPLCMLSLITPGMTSGSCVADCEEAAANEREGNFLSNEIHAKVEIKPPSSCHSIVPIKDPKMLQETLVSKTNENMSNEGSFTSEPLTKESKVQNNAASEKTTNNHSQVNSIVLSQTIEHNHPTFYSDGLKQSSDIRKAEKMSPVQSTDCVTSKTHVYKQINTYNEEIHIDDPYKNNKCELSSTCNTPENMPHLHTSFYNSINLNFHVTSDENTHNMPLEGNLNANAEELSKHIDVSEMPNKPLEEDNLRLPEISTNTPKHTIEVLPISTENESQTVDLKMEKITRNKQKESHASKSSEQFLVEGSLCGTVTGEMTEEENMGKLCSSSTEISGDLLNGNGKSCSDLSRKDKTVKKSDLPGGCQGKSQIDSVSISKMTFFLKEQLCTQEIKNYHSRKIGENMKGAEKREKTSKIFFFTCY